MKKRKTAILSFLLAAMLGIGVGYAAVSNTLKANGSVIIPENEVNTEFGKNVYFTNVQAGGDSDGFTARVIPGTNDDSIEFSVTGLKPADLTPENKPTITFTAQIANANTYAVNVAFSAENSDQKAGTFDANGKFTSKDGIFTIETALSNSTIEAATVGGEAKTITVTFTATLNKLPSASVNDALIIAFVATPAA